MNKRIREVFENGKAFIPFITGGDPDLETTERLIVEMAASGADMIEIGIPFSDPIAEGEVIQAASQRALERGTTADRLFEMVQRVRRTVKKEFLEFSRRYGVDLISMIAPTSGERARAIGRKAEGFLYCVSSLGVTGELSVFDCCLCYRIHHCPVCIFYGTGYPAG